MAELFLFSLSTHVTPIFKTCEHAIPSLIKQCLTNTHQIHCQSKKNMHIWWLSTLSVSVTISDVCQFTSRSWHKLEVPSQEWPHQLLQTWLIVKDLPNSRNLASNTVPCWRSNCLDISVLMIVWRCLQWQAPSFPRVAIGAAQLLQLYHVNDNMALYSCSCFARVILDPHIYIIQNEWKGMLPMMQHVVLSEELQSMEPSILCFFHISSLQKKHYQSKAMPTSTTMRRSVVLVHSTGPRQITVVQPRIH